MTYIDEDEQDTEPMQFEMDCQPAAKDKEDTPDIIDLWPESHGNG